MHKGKIKKGTAKFKQLDISIRNISEIFLNFTALRKQYSPHIWLAI